MLNRSTFRRVSMALILALLGMPAINSAGAQDQPRPPQPKQPQQQQSDPSDKKAAQRQVPDADGPGTLGEDRIKIDTNLVNLEVTEIHEQNKPLYQLETQCYAGV